MGILKRTKHPAHLTKNIQRAHHTQPQDHRAPKTHIIQHLPPLNPPRPLQHHNWQLAHLAQEPVAADFLRDASHDDFVADGGDEEGDEGGHGAADVGA